MTAVDVENVRLGRRESVDHLGESFIVAAKIGDLNEMQSLVRQGVDKNYAAQFLVITTVTRVLR
jgi:hypothetical protein